MSMLTIKHSNYFSTFANNLKKYTMRILKPLALSVLILFISSCGLTNMANKYDEVRYTTTPPILETHAGKISLGIEGVFPPKYFAKKATIEITPVLVSDNGEKEFKKIILQGEEASGGDSSQVSDQLSSGVTHIYSTYYAFAALKEDGSVVAWGNSSSGGDSSSVSSSLSSGVSQIYSNYQSFAALKDDGSVVTWGQVGRGGDSSSVSDKLKSDVK